MEKLITTDPFLIVVRAVKSERLFQDEAVADPNNPVMIDLQMGAILAAIQLNLNKALTAWYSDSAPYQNVTPLLRKIAALSFQAGEKWGMPQREIQHTFLK